MVPIRRNVTLAAAVAASLLALSAASASAAESGPLTSCKPVTGDRYLATNGSCADARADVKAVREHGFRGAASLGIGCFWRPDGDVNQVTCLRTGKNRTSSGGVVIIAYGTKEPSP